MKAVLAALALLGGLQSASAQSSYGNSYGGYGSGSNSSGHSVRGHFSNDGSYTQPHYRTNPNSTQYDNYGSSGNYNPYTGRSGTRTPRY